MQQKPQLHTLRSARPAWRSKALQLASVQDWCAARAVIRADEDYREGYTTKADNLFVKLPFREAGIDKAAVIDILESSGVGYPKYYEWRSRSGCGRGGCTWPS